MVKELNLPVTVSIQPTIREPDGLAMSSRNSYLNPDERKSATILYSSLQLAESLLKQGKKNSQEIINAIQEKIAQEKSAKPDYIAIVDPQTLDDQTEIHFPLLICLAVHIGKTRLIDNFWLSHT